MCAFVYGKSRQTVCWNEWGAHWTYAAEVMSYWQKHHTHNPEINGFWAHVCSDFLAWFQRVLHAPKIFPQFLYTPCIYDHRTSTPIFYISVCEAGVVCTPTDESSRRSRFQTCLSPSSFTTSHFNISITTVRKNILINTIGWFCGPSGFVGSLHVVCAD